jgi:hypothetical protein
VRGRSRKTTYHLFRLKPSTTRSKAGLEALPAAHRQSWYQRTLERSVKRACGFGQSTAWVTYVLGGFDFTSSTSPMYSVLSFKSTKSAMKALAEYRKQRKTDLAMLQRISQSERSSNDAPRQIPRCLMLLLGTAGSQGRLLVYCWPHVTIVDR